MSIRITTAVSLLWLLYMLVVDVAGYDAPLSDRSLVEKLGTPEAAVLEAIRVIGVPPSRKVDTGAAILTARLVTMVDSTTPFLSRRIDGAKAWRVELKNMTIHRAYGNPLERAGMTRDFIVYLDVKTALPFGISSRLEKFEESDWHKPGIEDAEAQLVSHKEMYLGFPGESPKVGVLEAIGEATGDPYTAEQIVCTYVMHSHLDKDPRPVWIVHMYGVWTPLSTRHPELPRHCRDHYRSVVDAVTGEFIFAGNLPQPVDECGGGQ